MPQKRRVLNIMLFLAAIVVVRPFVSFRNPLIQDLRVVQILRSSDRRYEAELVRRHAFLDLNFIIRLNGEQIYVTPDFRPNYTLPFRETLLWDTTGQNLILEIAGRRLFGYNVDSGQALAVGELRNLKVRPVRLEDLNYEGNRLPSP